VSTRATRPPKSDTQKSMREIIAEKAEKETPAVPYTNYKKLTKAGIDKMVADYCEYRRKEKAWADKKSEKGIELQMLLEISGVSPDVVLNINDKYRTKLVKRAGTTRIVEKKLLENGVRADVIEASKETSAGGVSISVTEVK